MVRSTTASGWDHLPNPNLSPAKPTFKLKPLSTTFNHQIHQPLVTVKTHLPPLMNPRERFTTMANPTNPSTTIDESDVGVDFDEVAVAFPPLLVAVAAFFLLVSDCEKRKNMGWELGREREILRREKKNQIKKWEEREKSNKIIFFGLAFVSILLQICNGTDTNGKNLAHIEHLMGGVFCVWYVKCAKYLAHLLWMF